MLSSTNIEIDYEVIQLLKHVRDYPCEAGGVIFGLKTISDIRLKTLSYKKGDLLSVTFKKNDYQIFYEPDYMEILGTWHFHPGNISSNPSFIDKAQYFMWGRKYIHIICNNLGYKIFDYRGRCIYEESF